MLNVHTLARARRDYPTWNTRARIRKVDESGNVVQGQYAYGGEHVRVSPRYQKNGTNFRVRPERPAVFFAAWAFENGLLPTALTPEEAESPAGLELLQPLFDEYKGYFSKIESPFAACDQATEPSLKVGFSFNIYQVLVEPAGSVKPVNGAARALSMSPVGNGDVARDAIKKKIEEMRSRTATAAPTSALPFPLKNKK
jgi:hypothetical protein